MSIVQMKLSDIFANVPSDNKINPRPGITFTSDVPGIVDAPAYASASHLAAWHMGYMTAKALINDESLTETMLDHLENDYITETSKENN